MRFNRGAERLGTKRGYTFSAQALDLKVRRVALMQYKTLPVFTANWTFRFGD